MSETIKVNEIQEYANKLLKNPELSQEFKQGVPAKVADSNELKATGRVIMYYHDTGRM